MIKLARRKVIVSAGSAAGRAQDVAAAGGDGADLRLFEPRLHDRGGGRAGLNLVTASNTMTAPVQD